MSFLSNTASTVRSSSAFRGNRVSSSSRSSGEWATSSRTSGAIWKDRVASGKLILRRRSARCCGDECPEEPTDNRRQEIGETVRHRLVLDDRVSPEADSNDRNNPEDDDYRPVQRSINQCDRGERFRLLHSSLLMVRCLLWILHFDEVVK